MLDSNKILATVRRATSLFLSTPGRSGSIVRLDDADEVLVVGDLHGHLHVFAQVLKLAALDRHRRRHLVLQEVVHDTRTNPETGTDFSHRLVDLVAALKCQYPERFHMVLGNHELSEITGRSIGKNGAYLNALFREGVEHSYGRRAQEMLDAYRQLFASWPLLVRTANRVLICHTVPNAGDLDRLDLRLLENGPWPEAAILRGGTVYALTWGRDTDPDTADRFARLLDVDWFITGHQPCASGFRAANHRQLILDGTDPCPSYCLFPAQGPVAFERLLEGARLVFG